MPHRLVTFILAALLLSFQPVRAEPVPMSGWEIVQFQILSKAKIAGGASTLRVETDGNGALAWRALPETLRNAGTARWTWSASEGVPATDLARKGNDDRVLSVYLLFGSEADIGKSATRLLRSETTRAVVYTFGGAYARGSIVASPHMKGRGSFIVLRNADAANGQKFNEAVDIKKDFARIFGEAPPLLLGVAVSSDSDDTGARNKAVVSGLSVDP
jgi:hypothetical protein